MPSTFTAPVNESLECELRKIRAKWPAAEREFRQRLARSRQRVLLRLVSQKGPESGYERKSA